MFSANINSFKLFKPVVELYKPENIKPLDLLFSLYCSSIVVEATAPLLIVTLLNTSLILLDSTPLPKDIQLEYDKLCSKPCSSIS